MPSNLMLRLLKFWLPLLAPGIVIVALTAGLLQLGVIRPIDRLIADARMHLSPRAPSGEVVFIAVDGQSLRQVGVWPWPRSIHADILDRLTQAGARDVFFDFDFAFPTTQSDDAAFAGALTRAAGTTYLPVFAQNAEGHDADILANMPMQDFANHSWPALVNVHVDADGILRNYLFGSHVDGEHISSMGSLLSGVLGVPGDTYSINFAIDPAGVPRYSFAEVISGDIPDDAFAGRSVIIGAYALELRDTFTVPVHGILPGAIVHALAAETLLLDAALVTLSPIAALPLLILLIALLQIQAPKMKALTLIRTTTLLLLMIEVAALILFKRYAILLPTGMLYPAVLIYGTWQLTRMLGTNIWLVQQKQAQLENTTGILAQVFADSSDAILVTGADGTILHHSKIAETLFALGEDQKPLLPKELVSQMTRAITSFQIGDWKPDKSHQATIGTGPSRQQIEYTITPSRVQSGADGSTEFLATISARDVTEDRRQAARIDYLSSHDERTGALRRTAFFRRMSRSTGVGRTAAVFAINLHRFKTINVTLGREVGDQVLRQTVIRLQSHAAGFEHVMRISGDSFAVFVSDIESTDAARAIARDIVQSVTRPFVLKDSRAQVGVRVGYAVGKISRDLIGPLLLDHAEEALDLARTNAGNRIAAYDRDTAKTQTRARAIEQGMDGAIEREEFYLLYQPQVTLEDGQLCGVEALVRWEHPVLGPIGPDEFIPIAESNGFIQELGRWVLKRAMREGMLLPPHVSLAVNVSPIQMMSNRVVQDIKLALDESGFQPNRLWLELTESTLLTPNAMMLRAMDDVERLGAAWALDDFGTGFSSLNYMATLPIRKLKVDRAFVQSLGADPSALAIIKSVKVLCDGLGIAMLCEGIETKSQAQILRAQKCVEGQGYLYGRPLKMTEVLSRYARTRRIAS